MDFASKLKAEPMERYQKTDKLGEGTYGIVYKAKDRFTDEARAFGAFRAIQNRLSL